MTEAIVKPSSEAPQCKICTQLPSLRTACIWRVGAIIPFYEWTNFIRLKFVYSEKATKIWRNLQTFFDSITNVLGNSFGDLLMCQSLNVEFWILCDICWDFLYWEKVQKNSFDPQDFFSLSFEKLKENIWKFNKYYVIFKIQHSNFDTLANCQMSHQRPK